MQIKELYTNKEEINIYTYLQKCGISNVDLYLDNSYIESIDNCGQIVVSGRYIYDIIKKLPNEIINLEEVMDFKLYITN